MEIKTRPETIEEISKIFKFLGDPTRIGILLLLEKEELNVNSIADNLNMEQSAISHQLKTLKEARIVKCQRNGKSNIYSLDDCHIFRLLQQVRDHVEE